MTYSILINVFSVYFIIPMPTQFLSGNISHGVWLHFLKIWHDVKDFLDMDHCCFLDMAVFFFIPLVNSKHN